VTLHLYAVDGRFRPVLALFGLRPKSDGVSTVVDGQLLASFGWFHVATPMSNIEDAHITRHYRWWTAIGARTSWVDDGLTFGTNAEAGVCIHFKEKVPSPLSRKGHSALTVTVLDCQRLAEELTGPTVR
jgi:hypothetical protein